ncbi:hypothetical protein, partial [Mycolicibacterium sp.]|uniref:hypothetical protein n=1 Tax=Mycolicibacterium sp. TaxID=2320850 RepID=UPI00355F3486
MTTSAAKSSGEALEDLARLARLATWALMKGGDLDSLSGVSPLHRATIGSFYWDVIDAASRCGIFIDRQNEGIGNIYTKEELAAARDQYVSEITATRNGEREMSEVVKTLTATVRVIELSGKTRLTKQMFEQLNTNGFTSLDEIASRTSYLSIDDLIGKVNLFHAPGFLWALGRDNSTGELV